MSWILSNPAYAQVPVSFTCVQDERVRSAMHTDDLCLIKRTLTPLKDGVSRASRLDRCPIEPNSTFQLQSLSLCHQRTQITRYRAMIEYYIQFIPMNGSLMGKRCKTSWQTIILIPIWAFKYSKPENLTLDFGLGTVPPQTKRPSSHPGMHQIASNPPR